MTEEPTPGPPPAVPDDPLAGLFRAPAGSPGVVICTHRNPDPDSISSALALVPGVVIQAKIDEIRPSITATTRALDVIVKFDTAASSAAAGP